MSEKFDRAFDEDCAELKHEMEQLKARIDAGAAKHPRNRFDRKLEQKP